jgi:hypothetical protein
VGTGGSVPARVTGIGSGSRDGVEDELNILILLKNILIINILE